MRDTFTQIFTLGLNRSIVVQLTHSMALGILFLQTGQLTLLAENVPSFNALGISTAPNPVGSGARAMGQGNAFIAIADDATAASWNPAGLSQLVEPEISFAYDYFYFNESIQSRAHPESEGNDSFRLNDLNYFSAVVNHPYKEARNLTLSLNYFKQFRFDKRNDFPLIRPGDQGLFEVSMDVDYEEDGAFSVWAPAIGLDLTPRLAVGLAINIWSHSLTGSSSFKTKEISNGALQPSGGGNPRLPFLAKEENVFAIEEGYSFVLGAMYRFNRDILLGLVFKPQFIVDIDHVLRTFDTVSDNLIVTKNHTQLQFPNIIGAGISFQPKRMKKNLTMALDLTWTTWSDYQFTEKNITVNPITGVQSNVDKLRDYFTCRLGLEYLRIRRKYIIPFRFGAGYDPAPADKDVDDYYTVSLGTGLQWSRFMFDIAYQFRWGNNVNASFLREIDGTQNIQQHRVLASLIVYFGQEN